MGTDGGKVTEKGKKKKAKDAKKKDDNEKESCDDKNEEEGVMQRLKGRLSMRGKKKDKMEKSSDQQKECNGTSEDANKNEKAEKKETKKEIEEEPVVEEKKWVSGSKEKDAKKVEEEQEEEKVSKEAEKEEKKKTENAFLRMLRKLSFRKKKKKDGKGNTENESGVEEGNKGDKEFEKTLEQDNNGDNGDKLGEKRFGERETRPQSLVMSSGRPPPGPGRPPIHPRTTTPSSATANVSRPVSDLDSALRQFKLSTAESRESLRTLGSRQDLTQVEERVREAVGKNLSRQGSLRRGAGGSTSIPITLSVSLQELRANQ